MTRLLKARLISAIIVVIIGQIALSSLTDYGFDFLTGLTAMVWGTVLFLISYFLSGVLLPRIIRSWPDQGPRKPRW